MSDPGRDIEITREARALIQREARRRVAAVRARSSPGAMGRNGQPAEAADHDHELGVTAEWIATRALGLPWRPALWGERDVGGYEVRGTYWRRGLLIVHTIDVARAPRTPFILVVIDREGDQAVRGRCVGWSWGEDVLLAGHHPRLPRPAPAVEQGQLRPMAELP